MELRVKNCGNISWINLVPNSRTSWWWEVSLETLQFCLHSSCLISKLPVGSTTSCFSQLLPGPCSWIYQDYLMAVAALKPGPSEDRAHPEVLQTLPEAFPTMQWHIPLKKGGNTRCPCTRSPLNLSLHSTLNSVALMRAVSSGLVQLTFLLALSLQSLFEVNYCRITVIKVFEIYLQWPCISSNSLYQLQGKRSLSKQKNAWKRSLLYVVKKLTLI